MFMRLPFDFNNSNLPEEARIKLIYNSPELKQNIEISIDGDEISVEALLDSFQRFMGALGVCVPENVMLGFVEIDEDEEEPKDGGTIKFTLDDDEDDDDEEDAKD
jgi:hypothetical protein